MDLEIIGKKMLESLAVGGQVNGQEAKLADIKAQIARATEAVNKAIANKDMSIAGKKEAELALKSAVAAEATAKQILDSAKSNFDNAVNAVAGKQKELDKYDDKFMSELDFVIASKKDDKAQLESLLEAENTNLRNLQKDLVARRDELKSLGVEFNIGSKVAKTTTL